MRSSILSVLLVASSLQAQTGFLKPGDNLILENVPPIPKTIATRANPYGEFRTAALADWHPTRHEMLIITRFADTRQVHRVQMPGGARTQLTFFPENVGSASYEPVAGKYIVFTASQGGNERYQLYRFDPDTAAITLLTDGKSRNSGFRWSRKGDRLVYGSTRRNGADVDLYLLDPAQPKSDRLFLTLKGGGWSVLDWSPDDSSLLIGEYLSINKSRLHIVDIKSASMRQLTPERDDNVAYQGGRFSKDGSEVYTTSDAASEFRQLITLEVARGKARPLMAEQAWDVQGFTLSPDGGTLALVLNEDGRGTLHLLDVASGKLQTPKLPDGSVSGLDWHPDGKLLAFQLVSAKTPADVFTLDLAGKVARWTESETAIPTRDFAEPRSIAWTSFDGLKITGFAYYPPVGFRGKRPVVINIHGGPESQATPGFLGRLNYLVREMGVVALYPNIRGSAGYGKKYLQLDNGFSREGAYKDIGALLDWIAAQPDLDAGRVMVTGGSYGGHMTLAVSYLYADKIRCSVDVVGISNLRTFLENTESYRRDLRRVEYGDERDPKMRAFQEKIAPMNHLDKITRPLFIIHGANDPRVPLSEAEQILKALKKQGTPVWYLVAKDEGHGFAKKQNADFQFYATVRFIEEYLLTR